MDLPRRGEVRGKNRTVAPAADNIASFEEDRNSSCPEGFAFESADPDPRLVAGLDGLRTDWSASDTSGATVERVVSYFAVVADRVIVFAANGLTDDACLAREGAEFTPNVLELVLPTLDRLVAGSKLPSGAS